MNWKTRLGALRRRTGWAGIALYTALGLYLALSVRQTLRNADAWPIPSYGMFNAMPHFPIWIPRVQLFDDAGASQLVSPEQVLPVEFFRAAGMLQRGLSLDLPPNAREQFGQATLARLNDGGWSGFTERERSAAPHAGQHFTAMQVVIYPAEIPEKGGELRLGRPQPFYDSTSGR